MSENPGTHVETQGAVKVGDRVRMVADGWSTSGAVGMLGYIRHISDKDSSIQIELDEGGTYQSHVMDQAKCYRWTWALPTDVEVMPVPQPVRIRTVTEIVPGIYGRLKVGLENYVGQHITNGVGVAFVLRDGPSPVSTAALNASELRAAAAVLIQLAEALEGPSA